MILWLLLGNADTERWRWTRLKAALDVARSGTGRPPDHERKTVEAIVWRQRNGAKWRAVPSEFGPWWRAAQLHIRWSRAGVWERVFAMLRDAGQAELGEVFLDGTNVRAHHKAAGAKGGQARTPLAARAGATAQRPAPCATRAGCDARGRPRGFALISGQASELRVAPDLLLLAALLGTIRRVVCDAASSSAAWFALVMEAGALPVVRPNPTHPQPKHFDHAAYRRRHKIENMSAKLKEWRTVATRYDKTATSFTGGLYLAATFQWLS